VTRQLTGPSAMKIPTLRKFALSQRSDQIKRHLNVRS
jgi:hypothetical protein